MTFEKKTLVLMAIQGPLDPSKIPFLTSNRKVISLESDQHVLLYGTEVRQENDAEEALTHSIQLRSPERKILVCTEVVLFESQAAKINWNPKWNSSFRLLNKNEIAVSLDLVRIYQRIFDINAKRVKDESIFVLDRKKITPARIRGLRKKYSPLVGRKKELSQLLEVVEQSFEDQGQLASIIGDAGIGKTRLKVEFTTELEKKKIRVFEGYFSLNSDLNFRGFHQLVKQVLEENTETFSRWNLNESESAFLRYFLHPEEKNDIVKDLNEEEQTQGIFHSIQKLFANVGQQKCVFILDDFHWAGEKSVRLIDHLAQSMEKNKIAFFLIHRPTFIPTFQKRLNYHQIKLSPLQHDETKELVKNALKLDFITDGAVQTLNNLSLGNPLYVEEVLRELLNQKKIDIQKSEDIARVIEVQYPKGSIPTNIHSLITARLDLLSKEAKEILQWVCTFGFRENQDDFELFLQTLNLPLATFNELFEQGYLEEASMFPEHKYKFHHDLLYETIKQSIPESEWTNKNQKIAEFLHKLYEHEMIIHGDRIADFFTKGEMDTSSFNPIFEAAKIALEQKRYSNASRYFDECYKLFPKNTLGVSDLEFYCPFLDTLFLNGNKERSKAILDDWKNRRFANEESEIKYYSYYLDYLFTYHETEELLDTSRFAIDKFKSTQFKEDYFNFEVKFFQGLVFKFSFGKSIHLGLKLLRTLNNSHILFNKIDILYNFGFITQQLGYPNVGSYLTITAKKIADESNNSKLKSKVYQRIAYLAVAQGLYKEALRIWEDLAYLKEHNNDPTESFRIHTNSVFNLFCIGNYQRALSVSQSLVDDDADWNRRWALNWVGQTYLIMGAFSNTKEIIAKYRYFPTRDPYIRCNLLYLAGNYHYQQNNYRKAKSFYRYAKNFYLKKDQKIYGYQMQLFELRCKLLLNEVTPEQATQEFDSIVAREEMRKYFYEWFSHMMRYWFARHGCKIRFKPSEDFDPMKCNAVYLRMMMFVEKIKWLQHIGQNEKAETVKKQYLAHRQEMVFYVPDEFKKSYLEHPFYQV